MRLSQIITKLREELTDPSTSTNVDWSDAELVGVLTDQVLIMVRRQVAIDEAYHNHRFALTAASAVQRSSNIWAYRLPHWCPKVVEVRFGQDSGLDPRQRVLRQRDKFGGAGWRYSGRREIEVEGIATAEDLEVWCAKRPARLTKGTLPTQTGMASNQLRLDADTSADALLYPHETVADSYVNAVVELTGVNTVGHIVGGQVNTVVSSLHLQNEAGTLYTVLTFRDAWTVLPVSLDTYEMHPEIDDEHLRLLILLCARACWTRRGNKDEVRASELELHQEWAEFQRHMEPRGLQEPKVIKDHLYPETANTTRGGDDSANFYWGQ